MKVPSDRLVAYVTLVLQVATLCTLIWIGKGQERQALLTQALINQDQAMSTTYTDVDGLQHTVSTPYQGNTTAHQHKLDLIASFCVFPPADPPAWFNAERDCR